MERRLSRSSRSLPAGLIRTPHVRASERVRRTAHPSSCCSASPPGSPWALTGTTLRRYASETVDFTVIGVLCPPRRPPYRSIISGPPMDRSSPVPGRARGWILVTIARSRSARDGVFHACGASRRLSPFVLVAFSARARTSCRRLAPSSSPGGAGTQRESHPRYRCEAHSGASPSSAPTVPWHFVFS